MAFFLVFHPHRFSRVQWRILAVSNSSTSVRLVLVGSLYSPCSKLCGRHRFDKCTALTTTTTATVTALEDRAGRCWVCWQTRTRRQRRNWRLAQKKIWGQSTVLSWIGSLAHAPLPPSLHRSDLYGMYPRRPVSPFTRPASARGAQLVLSSVLNDSPQWVHCRKSCEPAEVLCLSVSLSLPLSLSLI